MANNVSIDDAVDAAAYGVLNVCSEYRGVFARFMDIYVNESDTTA